MISAHPIDLEIVWAPIIVLAIALVTTVVLLTTYNKIKNRNKTEKNRSQVA
jgi:hypothetical protein